MANGYGKVLDEHRRRLMRLSERRGVDRIKSLYDRAQSDLESKLARVAGRARQTFTGTTHGVMLAQVRQGQALIARNMAGEMNDISKETQVESLRGLTSDLSRLEKKFTGTEPVLPIDEASRFAGIIDARRTSLVRMHESSMARYGINLAGRMEDQMALSLATGETNGQAVERIVDTADVGWARGEMIVRTETAWAYNATHADGFKAAAEEMNDLMMRWVEHVDDDGEPMDDRVGPDSIAMHGQLATPGMPFRMPDDPEVDDSLQGGMWFHPPNRPNDRAVIAPWRPHWGIPGWEFRGTRKVWR